MRRWPSRWRFALACTVAITTTACTSADDAAAMLDDYRTRVQRAADVAVNPPQHTAPPRYPRHRDRRIAPADVRASLWELLFDLPDCDLAQLVSERNSSLGRLWPATQQLDYELRFRQKLDRCRDRLATADSTDEDTREWRERLDEISQAKRQSIPTTWWAATYDSAEFEQAFSPAAIALPVTSAWSDAPQQTLEQLIGLAGRLDPPQALGDVGTLDRALQQLAVSQRGGALLASQQLLIDQLDAASDALAQAIERPTCPQGVPTPRARILQNVFQNYYAARVQPYMARVQRTGDQWLTLHAALLATQTSDRPTAFIAFEAIALSRNPNSQWQHWNTVRERHVKRWQTLLMQCALMPGQTN